MPSLHATATPSRHRRPTGLGGTLASALARVRVGSKDNTVQAAVQPKHAAEPVAAVPTITVVESIADAGPIIAVDTTPWPPPARH